MKSNHFNKCIITQKDLFTAPEVQKSWIYSLHFRFWKTKRLPKTEKVA